MRFLSGIVVLMSLTLFGWGEEYFPSRGFHSFTVGQHQSFVEKRSSLWFQPRQKTPRSPMKTAKPFALQVRLTSDDSGFAYIGQGTHTEPEIHGEDLLPSLDPPPPAAEEFTIKPPTGDAVPLDGAAKGTEKTADSTEDKPAENRSSFGWIAGTGNQLGMLEWMGRDLAVVDYSAADRGSRGGSRRQDTCCGLPDAPTPCCPGDRPGCLSTALAPRRAAPTPQASHRPFPRLYTRYSTPAETVQTGSFRLSTDWSGVPPRHRSTQTAHPVRILTPAHTPFAET